VLLLPGCHCDLCHIGTAALDVSKFWADVDALAAATAGPMRAALLGESAALPAAALWPEPISERAQHGALNRCQPLNRTLVDRWGRN
jgi:hypothetical protein